MPRLLKVLLFPSANAALMFFVMLALVFLFYVLELEFSFFFG